MTHYFSEEQDSEFKLGLLKIHNLRGMDLELYTAPGIFSYKKLDNGTRALIEEMEANGEFLDLGCGIGVVGIVAAKLGADVTMSDINKRALKIARMNIEKTGVEAKVVKSDLYEKLGCYNIIASNPPYSAGMDVCKRIVKQAPGHMYDNGKLFIVGRHRIAGSRMEKFMEEAFGNCEVLAKSGGFWVYCSKKIKE